MTAIARTFILREPTHAASLWTFLKANAAALAAQGKPLAVRVFEHKAKRNNEQNALMWVRLGQISQQAWVAGRQFSAEVWHEQMKRDHLPEETASGVKKWDYLPNGDRALIMSTTDLDTAEFALYLTAIEAYAATELALEMA